jgi:hypothetical protein
VKYCTYLTIYSGNKLPPFYIGSSSIIKIENGYHGSVASKKYKNIWKLELKHHPELFNTIILTEHDDRKEATLKENDIQKKLRVVKNDLYINESYAVYDSFSDRDQSGKNNPMYGTSRSGENNPFYGMTHDEQTKLKMRGRVCTEENKEYYRKMNTGRVHSEESNQRKSVAKKGKPPNSAALLPVITKEKFICVIDTKKEYSYVNACQRLPEIKHLFWTKKIAQK